MKIAICDDDALDLHYIETLVLRYDATLETTLFQSAQELLTAFQTEFFDIVFMDIEMESPNGYEAAKILVQSKDRPLIIFVTNSGEYTIRGYGVAFRYITKPISASTLCDVLAAAIESISPQKIEIELASTKKYISVCDIYYVEACSHAVMIYTKAGNYKCHCSLREFEKQLPAAKFSKSHNSFIVNLGEVAATTRTSLTLTNGIELPISQRQYNSFDSALIQYIRRY